MGSKKGGDALFRGDTFFGVDLFSVLNTFLGETQDIFSGGDTIFALAIFQGETIFSEETLFARKATTAVATAEIISIYRNKPFLFIDFPIL